MDIIFWEVLKGRIGKVLSICSGLITTNLWICIFMIDLAQNSGADLEFFERGAKHSSGSLKQGVWGTQPPRSYRVFCFLKYRNAT